MPEPPRRAVLQRIAAALEAAAAALEALAEDLSTPPPHPVDEDPMLTVAEAAVEIRRSASHVRSACRRGVIKALRDGHGYRIRRSALAAYERRRTA
jgi:excisionase family DNA binding protein